MKPNFYVTAHVQGYDYNRSTGQYDPYYSSGVRTSHRQKVAGKNNKKVRPCSDYTFEHDRYGWCNTLTRYEKVKGVLIPTVIRDGPSSFISISPGLEIIQDGSLSEAQSKVFGQSLNYAMLAKDIIDANRMANDYFKRVVKAAPYLRKKQWSKALRNFFGTKSKQLAAANSWLEFQFGVLPTVNAVKDAYGHVALSNQYKSSHLLRIRSASRKIAIQKEPSSSSGWKQIPERSEEYRYVCYRYLQKKDFFPNIARFNIIEVGWDATPWSFLIDWFVPVGDYLKQFGSITTFTTDGCDSVKHVEKQSGTAKWLEPTQNGHQTQSVDVERVSFKRTVNKTLSLNMTLSEMIQRSKLNLSCRRTVTAFALARQRVGRK